MIALRAMILSAGFGSRLKGITKDTPKPLINLSKNTAIIDNIVNSILRMGINEIAINLHYKGNLIEKYLLKKFPLVKWAFYFELELLNTGGGISNAKDFLCEAENSIIINADILFFFDLQKLYNQHIQSGSDSSLIVIPQANKKRALIYKDNKLSGFTNKNGKCLFQLEEFIPDNSLFSTFTGIQFLSSKFIRNLSNSKFSIIDVYAKKIYEKDPANIINLSDEYWADLGTLETLQKAQSDYKLITKYFSIADISSVQLIFEGISQKRIFRIHNQNNETKIIISSNIPREIESWIEFSYFFEEKGIPVPHVYNYDNNSILVEDVGVISLYQKVLQIGLEAETIKNLYKKSIDILLKLSEIEQKDFPLQFAYPRKIYDKTNILYDLNYFNNNFPEHKLDKIELDIICNEIFSFLQNLPITPMHRDFQSTNLMVKSEIVSLIDLQSFRLGYALYDLASLLFDLNITFSTKFIRSNFEYASHKNLKFDNWNAFLVLGLIRILHDLGTCKELKNCTNRIKNGKKELLFIINSLPTDKIRKTKNLLKKIIQV